MTAFRFFHAADLHLDSPFKGLYRLPKPLYRLVRRAPAEAFRRLVDVCCRMRVDFVCLCGDLYELEEGRLEGPLLLQKGLWRLHEAGIRTFLIRGNHDPDDRRQPALKWPPTAHWFSSRRVESVPFYKEGREVARVYGFSHPVADFRANVASQFQRDEGVPFAVALHHANVDGIGGHENYAPARLAELLASGMDYWALGHVHRRQVLHTSPWVVYAGNLQGRHFREEGEKGGYLVEVEDGKVRRVGFVPLSPLVWRSVTVDLSGLNGEEAMLDRIRSAVRSMRKPSSAPESSAGPAPSVSATVYILRLELAGMTELACRLQRPGVLDDLAALLNEEAGWGSATDADDVPPAAVWIEEICNRTRPPLDLAAYPLLHDSVARLRRWRDGLKEGRGWRPAGVPVDADRADAAGGAAAAGPEEEAGDAADGGRRPGPAVREALDVLWNHPTARKYLAWNDDDWEEMLQEAESLLVTLMAAARGGGE